MPVELLEAMLSEQTGSAGAQCGALSGWGEAQLSSALLGLSDCSFTERTRPPNPSNELWVFDAYSCGHWQGCACVDLPNPHCSSSRHILLLTPFTSEETEAHKE